MNEINNFFLFPINMRGSADTSFSFLRIDKIETPHWQDTKCTFVQ